MGNIIALELKTGAIVGAYSQNGLDILKRIFKNQITRFFEVFSLPTMGEIVKSVEHRIQTKIHRSHIQRRNFRFKFCGRQHAFLYRHMRAAAGGDVKDRISRLFDAWQELFKHGWVLRGLASLRVACVQMQYRCTCFSRPKGGFGDLAWADWKIG